MLNALQSQIAQRQVAAAMDVDQPEVTTHAIDAYSHTYINRPTVKTASLESFSPVEH
jgi:predicted XRE-type DNA-binding protein